MYTWIVPPRELIDKTGKFTIDPIRWIEKVEAYICINETETNKLNESQKVCFVKKRIIASKEVELLTQ
ncbi:hypothetical protein A3Q56_04134 [Intoshia linei]|uniref:Uncharacterized protein n=1 Tax=Intoshia linei TaxID=1819745 RepID=A0A177B1Y9_9BILA|nr:hypothetical protein A3Q56_04134 [Intoshia linei]